MEAVRIIKEMRKEDELRQLRSGRANEHIRPRFAVWENVPGAFSSNKGEDFRVVLEELARIKDAEVSIPMPEKGKWKQSGEIVGDGWSIAWRTLDAQYHGVPQRRRRIFLVADFADECAGEILFECKGLPGYPSQSSEKGQGTSGDSSESIGESGERECIAFDTYNMIETGEKTVTLRANSEYNYAPVFQRQCERKCIGFDGYNQSATGNVSKAITNAATDSDHVPLVLQEKPIYCVDEGGGNVPLVAEPWTYQKITGPLMANTHPESYSGQDAYNDMFVTEPCYSIKDEGFMDFSEEVAAILKQRDYKMPQAVCYSLDRASFNQGENAQYDFQISDDGIAQTLIAKGPGAVSYYENIKYIVRRLTPTECARLQGMPDLWCRLSQIDDMSDEDYEFWKQAHKTYAEINGKTYRQKTKKQMITWYNKLQIDGSEYKAYGNGMALPCVRVPIHGIAKHGAKTMASLFDGIGGFPLAGLIDGIKTLWTSEIELFPIAVTIERFREYEKYGCFTFGFECLERIRSDEE